MAVTKTNNMWSRKIRELPGAVNKEQVHAKKGIKHYNEKLKRRPKVKKQRNYKVGDRVRALTKWATDVNTKMYKSYTSGRDPKTAIWTKTIYKVTAKSKNRRMPMYTLSNGKQYFSYQLQPILHGAKKLEVVIPKEKRTRAAKPKRPPARRDISSKLSTTNILTGGRTRGARRRNKLAPRDISSKLSLANIISGKRTRRGRKS